MLRFVAVCALLIASCQVLGQQIDAAYLQQYYNQQVGTDGQQADATPIVEQTPAADAQPQYYVSPQAQQIRVKDAVAQQVRAQQQQQYVAPSVRQYLQQPQSQPAQQHVQYVQQPQQQIHYRPSPAPKQTLAITAPHRPQQQQQQHQHRIQPTYQQEEDERLAHEQDEDDQPASYQFGFDVNDDEFTNYQNRKESRDGNVIKGSYSVVDSDGFIRTVTYTADPKEGFKAEVVREPTDIVVKIPTPAPATVSGLRAHQQPQQPQPQPQHQPQQYYQPQQQSPLPYRTAQKQHY